MKRAKLFLIPISALLIGGCGQSVQQVKETQANSIPEFSFQTPDIYTSTVQDKVIKIAPTVRDVLFYTNNDLSGGAFAAPTEQIYTVNPKTNKWQMIYTNTVSRLKGEWLEKTDTASLGPTDYVVSSMWDGGTGGSIGYAEVVVVDTKQGKVIYEDDYQHGTLNESLYTLTPSQTKPIIQQYGLSYPTPTPKRAVAVLGATSGNVLYLYKNKVQDIGFNNQAEVDQLTLPPNSYVTITPSSNLSTIDEIQGTYENLTYATATSPATLTVKAGIRLVFNDISQDQYSAFTSSQGQVQDIQADMVNGGVTQILQSGLWTFLLESNNAANNQAILQVHVTQ